mmetsp:Transcript_2543/g.3709  ORF Transcript_2543/g.3709 Transcript_2543/m.3709 type:complete len:282 (+) Transcript_2543:53-898(+)
MQQVKRSKKADSILSNKKDECSSSNDVVVSLRNSLWRSNQVRKSQNLEFKTHECESIATNLIQQQESTNKLDESLSVNSLILKLWNPISSAEEIQNALNDIAQATASSKKNIILAFSRNGGIPAIVSTMKRSEENADIQEFACRALRNLAHDLEIVSLISKANGVASIVSSMQNHVDNPKIQAWAISAFVSISGSCSTKGDVVASGALKASLVAMRLYPNATVIQKKGCDLFYNISLSSVHRARLIQEKPQNQLKAAAVTYPKYCAKNANAVLFRLQPCAA